jgi:hypothetical protein
MYLEKEHPHRVVLYAMICNDMLARLQGAGLLGGVRMESGIEHENDCRTQTIGMLWIVLNIIGTVAKNLEVLATSADFLFVRARSSAVRQAA